MALRRRPARLTLGLRMALLPAILTAAATLAVVGLGRRGSGLGIAAAAGVLVVLAVALPIDLAHGRGGHSPPARRGRSPGGTRRHR